MDENTVMNIDYTQNVYKSVPLSELSPGSLFYVNINGTSVMAMKTEYGNNRGRIDAYIVGSGERLSMNGATSTQAGCDEIYVMPIEFKQKILE